MRSAAGVRGAGCGLLGQPRQSGGLAVRVSAAVRPAASGAAAAVARLYRPDVRRGGGGPGGVVRRQFRQHDRNEDGGISKKGSKSDHASIDVGIID